MEVAEIVKQIGALPVGVGAVVVMMTLIQVAPIQVNPWSWIAGKIRKALLGELITKIEKVEAEVKEIRKEMGEDRAIDARVRILEFADEMFFNQKHSKESFDQILDDIKKYNTYCDDHPDFENDKAVIAANNIKRCYQKCLEDHDFL